MRLLKLLLSVASKHAYRFGFLKSEKWKTVRLEALVREGGKCEICTEESIFNDAHHIWYPKNIYETTQDHLAVLCRTCHEFLHVMLPDCKTKNEGDGKRQWLKFKNAIIAWRIKKLPLFSEAVGLEPPQNFRDEICKLKTKMFSRPSVNGSISFNKAELGRIFEPLNKFKTGLLHGPEKPA